MKLNIEFQIGVVGKAMSIAGKTGVANLPEAVKAHATTEGGRTPFVVFDNLSTRAIGEDA